MQIAKPNTVKFNVDNYHKIEALSGSLIKLFDTDRMKFYTEVVLKQKRTEKLSDSMIIGSLIDFILTDCKGDFEEFTKRFDEKFTLLSIKPGTGQLFLLADLLFEYTQRDMDETGEITTEFLNRFKEAFEKLQSQEKFKGKKIEDVINLFSGSDAEIYFKEKLTNIDKIPVDLWMLDFSKNKAESVVNDENIQLFKDNCENIGKTVIEWSYESIPCKSELDNLRIDHENKKVIITEIKSNWNSENFEYTYLKLKYYLSAKFYEMAVKYWINKVNPHLSNYQIIFEFLTVDTSKNGLRPLIRRLSKNDLNSAWKGFKVNGWEYKGLKDILDEITWCSNTGIYNISKLAFENNSSIPLNINYQ